MIICIDDTFYSYCRYPAPLCNLFQQKHCQTLHQSQLGWSTPWPIPSSCAICRISPATRMRYPSDVVVRFCVFLIVFEVQQIQPKVAKNTIVP